MFTRFLKATVAGATALATWGGTALADGEVTTTELVGLLLVPAAFGAVWKAKNTP